MADINTDTLNELERLRAEAGREGAEYYQEPKTRDRETYRTALENAAPALIAAARRDHYRNETQPTHHDECWRYHVDCAVGKVEELRGVLACVEWQGDTVTFARMGPRRVCPVCDKPRPMQEWGSGHALDCALARALGE